MTSLDELSHMKEVHELLSAPVSGPPALAYAVQSFRFLQMFGITSVVQNNPPALSRCWKDLEGRFMQDPAFSAEVFIPSWILLDFPCGPDGRTAVDYFETWLGSHSQLQPFKKFIDAVRPTRLGLYQEVVRSKRVARYRELFTGRVIEAYPSVERGEPGELILARALELDGSVYFWDEVKAFPADSLQAIEDMVGAKLFYFGNQASSAARYESFMKLAGPYWMSVVGSNDALPILAPNHYLTYLH